MESTTHLELKTGIFVGIGLLLLLGTIVVLGGGQSFFTSTYTLKVKFREVQGLGPGSVVSLAGLPIGNVKAIEFSKDGKSIEVITEIDEAHQSRITNESLASIKTQGALGDKYIFISPAEEGRVLNDGDYLTLDPEGDFFDKLISKAEGLEDLGDVAKELHILLKNINADGNSRKMSENLALALRDLRQVLQESQLLLKDIRGSSAEDNKLRQSLTHLSSILNKIDKGDGTLGAIVNNKALYERIMGFVGESPRNQFLKPLIRDSIRTQDKSP